jgi:hypothetical protein
MQVAPKLEGVAVDLGKTGGLEAETTEDPERPAVIKQAMNATR